MADLVDEMVQGIRARLKELAPAVAEYERLQAADAALDGSDGQSTERSAARAAPQPRRRRRSRGGRAVRASRPSAPRARRGQNKAAVFGVIAERPGVTVSEIAEVTGIAKPLVYNTTRAGVERGELERVALPDRLSGFRPAQASTQPPTSPE
jgi:hypothetical protein